MCLIFFLVKPWDDMLNLVVLVELSHFWFITNHTTVRVFCMSKYERWVDTKFCSRRTSDDRNFLKLVGAFKMSKRLYGTSL
jgi:hypothetical protein